MRVHHLNCATMRPYGGRLIDGRGGLFHRATMVCHCLLIETDDGLVLVDTGLGVGDVTDPDATLTPRFRFIAQPVLDIEETAVRQVARLGYDPVDVRHIVLTHLDVDHAGGLPDFPHATVHVHQAEHRAAMARATPAERSRYRPQHWAHGPDWRTYGAADGERWFGFEAVRELDGLPPQILLIPLAGHTRGHSGVAVDLGDRWLLHAGDAIFFHRETDPVRPYCPPGLDGFQRMMETEREPRLANQERLRALARDHGEKVHIFPAHDLTALRRAEDRAASRA